MKISILGLSITSSWGNGHATTYRSLVKGLYKRGHEVTFLERDMPWYAQQRDFTQWKYCNVILYNSIDELKKSFSKEIEESDIVIVGSYVPKGVEVGSWVIKTATGIKAFYDIDTPVTFAKLKKKDYEYLHPRLVPMYDLYLSFSGGPALQVLETGLGSPNAKPFYCSVDPDLYFPENVPFSYDMGYIGTYSADRQAALEKLMISPAKKWENGKFIVAGPQFPENIKWPSNIERIEHLSPEYHRRFYNSQRYTLNITRAEMVKFGFSPSVRLFEAAACKVPIISDYWQGIESLLEPGKDILISKSAKDTLEYLQDIDDLARRQIAYNAWEKITNFHTGEQRAVELENYILEIKKNKAEMINPN